MPGHVLSQCAYLKNFIAAARNALGEITTASITWRDPAGETRYGESKSHDWGLGLFEDIGPHIASILNLIAPHISRSLTWEHISGIGLSTDVRGHCDALQFSATLERGAGQRHRLLLLGNAKGNEATLDFSTEPGAMTIGGAATSADPDWTSRASPLTLQVQDFIFSPTAREDELAIITESTSFVAGLAAQIRQVQQAALESDWEAEPSQHLAMMREVIAPRAVAVRRLAAGDNAGLDALARTVLERLSAQSKPNLDAVLNDLFAQG
jgi:hypothetical protein